MTDPIKKDKPLPPPTLSSIPDQNTSKKIETFKPFAEKSNTQNGNLPLKVREQLLTLQKDEANNVRAFLLATYTPSNKQLPSPKGKKEGTHESVILWRGCRADQLVKMAHTGSAGGVTANKSATPPTEVEITKQVAEKDSLPEFTPKTEVAESFGRGSFVVAVEIETKYLALASTAERGFVCSKDAPIKIIAWKEGQPLIQSPKKKSQSPSSQSPQ